MSKRKANFKISSRPPDVDLQLFEPSADDWARIESAYGSRIPPAVRDEIVEITNRLIEDGSFETWALPVTDAIVQVRRLRQRASDLRDDLFVRGALPAMNLVYQNFCKRFQSVRSSADTLNLFTLMLQQFVEANAEVLSELEDPNNRGGWRKGDKWSRWIVTLTDFVRSSALPYEVRKDIDNDSRPSPFVILVGELQKYLPRSLQRGIQSDVALAKAIDRARREFGTQQVQPTS